MVLPLGLSCGCRPAVSQGHRNLSTRPELEDLLTSQVMWLLADLSCLLASFPGHAGLALVLFMVWQLASLRASNQNGSYRLLYLHHGNDIPLLLYASTLEECRKGHTKAWIPGSKDNWRTILETDDQSHLMYSSLLKILYPSKELFNAHLTWVWKECVSVYLLKLH